MPCEPAAGVPEELRALAEAEARGYARGIEDAARVADTEFGYLGSDALVARIRGLAKPTGERGVTPQAARDLAALGAAAAYDQG